MIGMNAHTGKALAGNAHLAQSIADILTTPVGSRVMRRDYGSNLPALIDAPANPATRALLYAATATALARWEPRIVVQRIQLDASQAQQARFTLTITGQVANSTQTLRVPLAAGALSA